jgi:hypothetical protein
MAFWDKWSTQQKLVVAGLGGVGALYMLTKGTGGGSEGELAIVDVRRPTDDINAPGGAGSTIGRLEINMPGAPVVPGKPGKPGKPGEPGLPGTPGGGYSAWDRIMGRIDAVNMQIQSARNREGSPQNIRKGAAQKRIVKLRERRTALEEKLSNVPIPPGFEEEAPGARVPRVPRETRRNSNPASVEATRRANEDLILQLRRTGRLG